MLSVEEGYDRIVSMFVGVSDEQKMRIHAILDDVRSLGYDDGEKAGMSIAIDPGAGV